jgi:hypothetical protein
MTDNGRARGKVKRAGEDAPDVIVTPERDPTFTLQELQWLVSMLQQVTIPEPQGKMIAASIQVKCMSALETE